MGRVESYRSTCRDPRITPRATLLAETYRGAHTHPFHLHVGNPARTGGRIIGLKSAVVSFFEWFDNCGVLKRFWGVDADSCTACSRGRIIKWLESTDGSMSRNPMGIDSGSPLFRPALSPFSPSILSWQTDPPVRWDRIEIASSGSGRRSQHDVKMKRHGRRTNGMEIALE